MVKAARYHVDSLTSHQKRDCSVDSSPLQAAGLQGRSEHCQSKGQMAGLQQLSLFEGKVNIKGCL
jgi:hypothetical protein